MILNLDCAASSGDEVEVGALRILINDDVFWEFQECFNVIDELLDKIRIALENDVHINCALKDLLRNFVVETWRQHCQELFKFCLVVQVALR